MRAFAGRAPRSSERAMTKPTTKLPRTLTASVPRGNSAPLSRWTAPASQYGPLEERPHRAAKRPRDGAPVRDDDVLVLDPRGHEAAAEAAQARGLAEEVGTGTGRGVKRAGGVGLQTRPVTVGGAAQIRRLERLPLHL